MAGIGSWGGGIVLLVAAVLWLVYLMPSWAARRQYLATERERHPAAADPPDPRADRRAAGRGPHRDEREVPGPGAARRPVRRGQAHRHRPGPRGRAAA
ncbi:hypothetical protein Q9Q99_09980 [Curtobacterium flaccumfaciens]|nr:hypothetical protein Q9Q99_09980 [Curtobacterium flaccumfaciens]